jgi:hypothetical protein
MLTLIRIFALATAAFLLSSVSVFADPTASPSAAPAGCTWQGKTYPEGTLGSVDCNGETCSAILCKNGAWAAPATQSAAGPGKCFVDSDCPPKLS